MILSMLIKLFVSTLWSTLALVQPNPVKYCTMSNIFYSPVKLLAIQSTIRSNRDKNSKNNSCVDDIKNILTIYGTHKFVIIFYS